MRELPEVREVPEGHQVRGVQQVRSFECIYMHLSHLPHSRTSRTRL